MVTVANRSLLHPLHAILLAFPVALFISAVVSDITYRATAEMQWSHFSSWLIAGGLLLGGLAMVWAFVDMFRVPAASRRGWLVIYPLLLLAMWVVGLFNAFLHARDAWYSVTPFALLLSVMTALLAFVAAWIGYSGVMVRRHP